MDLMLIFTRSYAERLNFWLPELSEKLGFCILGAKNLFTHSEGLPLLSSSMFIPLVIDLQGSVLQWESRLKEGGWK